MNKLLCGDCSDLMTSFQKDSIDLILTDIPYGISYKSNKQNCDTRNNKSLKKDRKEYFQSIQGDDYLPTSWLHDAFRILKSNSAIYIFCHWSTWHLLFPAVEDVGFTCKNMIVMNKSNHGMGDLKGQYAPKHELLLYATKGRHILNFPDKRMNDIWDVPVKYSGSKRLHPNEKPTRWLTPCILNSSKKGDIVLDPFCGSGATGEAATILDRCYILIDIDKKYIEVAKKRMEDLK